MPLRGFLLCPKCGRQLTGSASKGRHIYYYYYHCIAACSSRYKAELVDDNFLNKLNQFVPKPGMAELFKMIVKNIYSQQVDAQLEGRKELLHMVQVQNDTLTKARKLLLDDAIDSADYKSIKLECETKLLNLEAKLTSFGKQSFDLESSINKAVSTLNRLVTIYKKSRHSEKADTYWFNIS